MRRWVAGRLGPQQRVPGRRDGDRERSRTLVRLGVIGLILVACLVVAPALAPALAAGAGGTPIQKLTDAFNSIKDDLAALAFALGALGLVAAAISGIAAPRHTSNLFKGSVICIALAALAGPIVTWLETTFK